MDDDDDGAAGGGAVGEGDDGGGVAGDVEVGEEGGVGDRSERGAGCWRQRRGSDGVSDGAGVRDGAGVGEGEGEREQAAASRARASAPRIIARDYATATCSCGGKAGFFFSTESLSFTLTSRETPDSAIVTP